MADDKAHSDETPSDSESGGSGVDAQAELGGSTDLPAEDSLPPVADDKVEVAVEEVVEENLNKFGFRDDEMVDDDEEENWEEVESISPIEEFVDEKSVPQADLDEDKEWYILKVQVNRENSICDTLRRKVKVEGMEHCFGEILVPTEDVREFTKAGKQRVIKRKLYPGYIVVNMKITDESWFLVRETGGIGDFTGAVGRPKPLTSDEVERIMTAAFPAKEEDGEEATIKTAIPFKLDDRVRVKEGYFQNYEGDVSNVDERNGRITVLINIFGRPNPVELDHWHVEKVQ